MRFWKPRGQTKSRKLLGALALIRERPTAERERPPKMLAGVESARKSSVRG